MIMKLTADEAALFNAYAAPTRRILINLLTTGIPYIEDLELLEIANSLKFKVKDMNREEYRELFGNIPLECGF